MEQEQELLQQQNIAVGTAVDAVEDEGAGRSRAEESVVAAAAETATGGGGAAEGDGIPPGNRIVQGSNFTKSHKQNLVAAMKALLPK